ncbi:MAG: hypothetical protein Rhirs2KO_32170 [Rhizobiaceae bacterium]
MIAASLSFAYDSASAESFVSEGREVSIETIPRSLLGGKQLIFYCSSAESCRAEEYSNEADGKRKITFRLGQGNTVVFWPEGENYMLEHHSVKTGQVTPWTLYGESVSDPVVIPDTTLFGMLPIDGTGESEIRIAEGGLNFCPNKSCLGETKLFTVGNRLGYAGLFNNALSIMIGRLDKDEFNQLNSDFDGKGACGKYWGNEIYFVSIHGPRGGKTVLDQVVFCDTKKD